MSFSRIYLSGAHSTGKTTILNDIKPRLNICVQEEIARTIIRELDWDREDFLPDRNPENFFKLNEKILQQQILTEFKHAESSDDFIADRCLDPLIYVEQYLGKEAKAQLMSMQGASEWIERLKSALIFVIRPHRECIRDDRVRLPPSLEELEKFHTAIMEEYKTLGIPVTEVTVLDRQARKSFVMEKIKDKFPHVIADI